MKLRTFVLSGLIGAGLYKLYQSRHTIEAEIKDKTSRIKQGQQDLTQIQNSLATIQDEGNEASRVAQDLTYQARVFQTEAQATLQEINKILSKYKSTDTDKTTD